MNIKEYLEKNRLIMDGAMGTYYVSKHTEAYEIPELVNLTDPKAIEQIHREYIEAGAKLIRTNTFAANQASLNLEISQQEEVIRRACRIAKEVAGKDVFVAGDIGPIPEHGDFREDDIIKEYQRICNIFIEEELDIILFETFSDFRYIRQLIPYIKEKKDVFIMANFCIDKNGFTSSGISARRILETGETLEGLDSCGFNCGIGSGHMKEIVRKLKLPRNQFVAIMPNAGYPEQLQNRMVFMDNSYYFGENMKEIGKLGVDMIGGCCGTTPAYIKELVDSIGVEKSPRVYKEEHREVLQDSKSKEGENEFYKLFATGKKVIAVELDPPYDADYEQLIEYAHVIKAAGADIITMADSPMGRSRVDSVLMSIKIAKETGIKVMPHIGCRDKNMIAMRSTLLGAYINQIRNILVVTGDPVPSANRSSTTAVFDYNSIQLMEFIKEMNQEHFLEEPLYYGGALNQGRGQIEKVIERLERKIKAGAKYFLTQPIYSDEDIERIRYIKSKVDTKILCGIMPLVSYRNANFIKNEITGIHVPEEIVDRYHPDMTKEEGREVGAIIANEIMKKLDSFADGYYFMLPFNRVSLLDKLHIEKRG